nr:immunoglobulin light chain junction region [Macaca mulatta]
YQQCNSLPYSF